MANVTLNINDKTDNAQLSENNTKVVFTSVNGYVRANKSISKGKRYFEVHTDTNADGLSVGVAKPSITLTYNSGYCFYYQGYTYPSGVGNSANSYQTGNRVIGVAIDMDSSPRTVNFYLDNVLIKTETIADSETELFPFINQYYYEPLPKSVSIKFDLASFTYAVPQGYIPYGSASKFLLKQGSQYYALKDNYLVLLDSQTLDETNFNANGFSNLDLLTQVSNTYKITKQLQGNMCEFDINNDMEKIEVV